MPDIDLGNYEIDEDSNGDLVIKDSNDNEVMKYDGTNSKWDFGSETLDNIGSLSTGALEDGVAGDGNSIDAIAGGSQTFRLVAVIPVNPGGTYSTTSTTFANLTTQSDITEFDLGQVPQMVNIEPTLYVGVNGRIEAPANETSTIRFSGLPDTEQSASDGFGFPKANQMSDFAQTSDAGIVIEGKTTAGTANFDRISVSILERIE